MSASAFFCRVVICLALGAAAASASVSLHQLGNGFKVKNPSFVQLFPRYPVSKPDETALWITQFTGSPLAKGRIAVVENVYDLARGNFSQVKPIELSDTFVWPNYLTPIPKGALQAHQAFDGVLVPDGFLVPGKSDGSVNVLGSDGTTKVCLTAPKKKWFYHYAEFRDMDGDGVLDILTARATKPVFGKSGGELLWLKQPVGVDPLKAVPWEEHVVVEGPDVLFTVVNETAQDFTLVAPQFFSKKLSMVTIDKTTGKLVTMKILDDKIGGAYVARLIDVNGDGVDDLMVNNHEGGVGGTIFAYDGSTSFSTRYNLSHPGDFVVRVSGFNQASPGFIYPFFPPPPAERSLPSSSSSSSSSPYILVAGDGGGSATLMTPAESGSNPAGFNYEISTIVAYNKTVGTLGVVAPNMPASDPFVFVPDYEGGFIMPFEVTSF